MPNTEIITPNAPNATAACDWAYNDGYTHTTTLVNDSPYTFENDLFQLISPYPVECGSVEPVKSTFDNVECALNDEPEDCAQVHFLTPGDSFTLTTHNPKALLNLGYDVIYSPSQPFGTPAVGSFEVQYTNSDGLIPLYQEGVNVSWPKTANDTYIIDVTKLSEVEQVTDSSEAQEQSAAGLLSIFDPNKVVSWLADQWSDAIDVAVQYAKSVVKDSPSYFPPQHSDYQRKTFGGMFQPAPQQAGFAPAMPGIMPPANVMGLPSR